jgi:hypothetical protein
MTLGELNGGRDEIAARRLRADDAHLLRAVRLAALLRRSLPSARGEVS